MSSTTSTTKAFENRFCRTFLPTLDSIDLTTRIVERFQVQGEDTMDYIYDKLKLLRSFHMPIEAQKKSPSGNVLMLPKTMRKATCIRYHDLLGHYSTEKVYAAISACYWFASIRQYIKTHIRCCFACIVAKDVSGKADGLLQLIPTYQNLMLSDPH